MRRQDRQPPKTKKYFRSTKSGAGMTKAGVSRYRRENPGSKLNQRSLARSNQDQKLLIDVCRIAQEAQAK